MLMLTNQLLRETANLLLFSFQHFFCHTFLFNIFHSSSTLHSPRTPHSSHPFYSLYHSRLHPSCCLPSLPSRLHYCLPSPRLPLPVLPSPSSSQLRALSVVQASDPRSLCIISIRKVPRQDTAGRIRNTNKYQHIHYTCNDVSLRGGFPINQSGMAEQKLLQSSST